MPLPKPLKTIGATLFTLFTVSHVVTLRGVRGKSMSPTLNPDTHSQNDIILVDTLTPLLISYGMAPNYSDKVVLLRHPCQDRMLVKRVEKQIEGKGVYVRGDEGFRSEDSRVFGTVPLALVRGVGLCIVYPLSRFGMTMERRSKFKSMK